MADGNGDDPPPNVINTGAFGFFASLFFLIILPLILLTTWSLNYWHNKYDITRINYNWASPYRGAKIVTIYDSDTCKPDCQYILGLIPFNCEEYKPEYILDPSPNSWCFLGQKAKAMIEFSVALKISKVRIAFHYKNDQIKKESMPKTITIYGYSDLNRHVQEYVFTTTLNFVNTKKIDTNENVYLQEFPVSQDPMAPVKYMLIKFETNHGADVTQLCNIMAWGHPFGM